MNSFIKISVCRDQVKWHHKETISWIQNVEHCMAHDFLLRQVCLPFFSSFFFEHLKRNEAFFRVGYLFLLLAAYSQQMKKIIPPGRVASCLPLSDPVNGPMGQTRVCLQSNDVLSIGRVRNLFFPSFKKNVFWPKLHCQFSFYQSPILGEKGTFAKLLWRTLYIISYFAINYSLCAALAGSPKWTKLMIPKPHPER